MLDFRLRVFYKVAQNLSFTKAAKELFITQPAVTKHIKELEALYGLALFSRKGNRIALTDGGKVLLAHAHKIMQLYLDLDFEMAALKKGAAGDFHLGASSTISQYVIPEALAALTTRFPDIHLSLLNGNSEDIEKALLEETIDLGIVEGLAHNPQLKYELFMEDRLVGVVCSEHPLAHQKSISLEELKNLSLVLREPGSGTREVIEKGLDKVGMSLQNLQVTMELGSSESIKQFLLHSEGLGILSIRTILRERQSGTLLPLEIEDLDLNRTFRFVHRQGPPAKLAELVMDFTKKYFC